MGRLRPARLSGFRPGWSMTEITDAAVEAYGDQVAQMAAASVDSRQSQRNGIVAVCACPDALKIRIRGADAADKLAGHPIRSDTCSQLYQPA